MQVALLLPMTLLSRLILAMGLLFPTLYVQQARACGGFFCGFEPVDQSAERIMFRLNNDDTVTMTVQITYQGEAEDFAWILPLPEVPDPDKLSTFPLDALVALDAQTGPQFIRPCNAWGADAGFVADASTSFSDAGAEPEPARPPVIVHVEKEVGNYIAAVVESKDPEALHAWLLENGYRVADTMKPYIKLYTDEGMKFLALKLQAEADVSDIVPFQLTMPGQTPSIPLRLTGLAAEPEMSIAVFVLADRRFEAADWPNLKIDPNTILWSDRYGNGLQTNYSARVAQAVDENDGKGWVTQFAGATDGYIDAIRSQKSRLEYDIQYYEEQEAAAQAAGDEELRQQWEDARLAQEQTLNNANAMLSMMDGTQYITRLYTRLSPEEMGSDPRFKRSSGGDVSNVIELPKSVDGKNLCPDYDQQPDVKPCDLTTCGAGGICRNVSTDRGLVAACGCVPGASARMVMGEDGLPTTLCQDLRMSFLNPGDRDQNGMVLPDPCASYSCGKHGTCITVNMTPTCECERGYVALADFEGQVQCVEPDSDVPSDFYDKRLPELALSGGRTIMVPPPSTQDAGCSIGASPRWGLVMLALLLTLGLLRRPLLARYVGKR